MDDHESANQQMLITFLKDRDVPCPLCQYNLRNLNRSNCPECGRPIELTVKVPDLSYASWIVMTFSMSLSAGISVLFLAIVAKEGMPRYGGAADAQWPIIGYFLTIPLAIWSITSRRKFVRLTQGSQQMIATLAVLLSTVLFILLISTLFNY